MKIVGITLKDGGRIYYFSPNNFNLNKGDNVIVETERGLQYGTVEKPITEIDPLKNKFELKSVIRMADSEDTKIHLQNILDANETLKKCEQLVQKYKLNMRVLEAVYTFNRDKLVFKFLSDNRIDFRELAKELANIYKTRIELRQIGVRDKAKEVGGLGICGQSFCCGQFLNNFDAISINMAKNQNIALNPNKINGACGRLLCCLSYENDCYSECRKNMPIIGKKVKTKKGEGIVISINILKQTYRVSVPEVGIIEEKINE